jgi:SAM-dependent methyltransferase
MNEVFPDSERYHTLPFQQVTLRRLDDCGQILDLGGGGEGVIGRLMGERVVAIDNVADELEDTPPGPLKIQMDATSMLFLDESFQTVTCFYTLLYMPVTDHPIALHESFRVLQPGGRMLIWDSEVLPYPGGEQDVLIVPVKVALPGDELTATYAIRWPGHDQSQDSILEMAQQTGFRLLRRTAHDGAFYLELEKVG